MRDNTSGSAESDATTSPMTICLDPIKEQIMHASRKVFITIGLKCRLQRFNFVEVHSFIFLIFAHRRLLP